MNCGRSSSVEWKLPKLQRRVRFPSPAPPPPGRAPGGFVMPARGELHDMRVDTPVTYGRRASCRAKPPPLQAGRAHGAYKTVRNTGWREKLAQHGSSTGTSAKKLARRAQKRQIWGVLSLLGELFRAYAHARPSRANFFAPGMASSRSRNDRDHYDTFIQST